MADARNRHSTRSLETLKLCARARLQTSPNAFEVLRPPNPDFKLLVSGIQIPRLLIVGDKGVVSSAVAEELQQLNPALQVKQIRQAGHALHMDQPERFAAVVKEFLLALEKLISRSNKM